MNRLELFKRKKRNRRLIVSTIIISTLLIIVGMLTVDYAFNNMLNAQEEIKILTLTKKEDSVYLFNFMNCTGKINFTYVKNDIDKVGLWANKSYKIINDNYTKIKDYAIKTVSNFK